MKDLTASKISRQNILNNNFALREIEKNLNLEVVDFDGDLWLSKKKVKKFYEISDSTIKSYMEKNNKELTENGYKILRGKALKNYKESDTTLTSEDSKITSLGIFSFRAFLNLGMLLSESQKAKTLRSMMVDIANNIINEKLGGHIKYVNKRDEDFLIQMIKEENYRARFADALNEYVAMGDIKYATYTNKIYEIIFNENAKEYREILKLKPRAKIRLTMYSEILALIADFEKGIADVFEKRFLEKKQKLTSEEVDMIFNEVSENQFLIPLIEKARNKMASWDLCFRDVLHEKLVNYVSAVPKEDFDKFLGENKRSLTKRLEETKEVFLRLKNR